MFAPSKCPSDEMHRFDGLSRSNGNASFQRKFSWLLWPVSLARTHSSVWQIPNSYESAFIPCVCCNKCAKRLIRRYWWDNEYYYGINWTQTTTVKHWNGLKMIYTLKDKDIFHANYTSRNVGSGYLDQCGDFLFLLNCSRLA